MDAKSQTAFVAKFLREYLETAVQTQQISQSKYFNALDLLNNRSSLQEKSRTLFNGGKVSFPHVGVVNLIKLREPNLREFPFLRVVPSGGGGSKRKRKKIKCFLGYRFVPKIEKSFRYNLALLFERYRIKPVWSGSDLTAASLFADIVETIKKSDMCIFDNLGTSNRPNVYIELGIAIAVGRPTIFCDYRGKIKTRPLATGSVPADLTEILSVRYKSYYDLCKTIYFTLPAFLKKHRLA